MIDETYITWLEIGAKAILILAVTFIFAKFMRRFLEKKIKRTSHLMNMDITEFTFLKHLIVGAVYVVGIGLAIYTVPALRAVSVSLLAGAGILAVIVGFASQAAFSNIVSGIFIAIFKPFRVDDRIQVGTSIFGVVEDINLRHTIVRNFENKRLIIPNSVISDEIIENSTIIDEKICRFIDIGISYESDVEKAIRIIKREAQKHPDFIDNRTKEEKENKKPAVVVRVYSLGESSINLRAWVWAADAPAAFRLGTDLNRILIKEFRKAGIEIPYPHRTIIYKDQKKTQKKR